MADVKRGVRQGSLRGKYDRASEESKRRIVEAADRGENWKIVAEANGVKEATAYNWIRSGQVIQRKRGGARLNASKLQAHHVELLLTKLSEDPQITLKEMKEYLVQMEGPHVSEQTLSRHLHCQLFTVKKVRHEPEAMNTIENKRKRREFTQRIMDHQGELKHILYVDEANVNLFLRRSFGRARRGQRATVKMPASRGANIHMIAAISQTGLEKFTSRRGSFRNEHFNCWLRELIEETVANGTPIGNIVIVIDNAPCHSRAEDVLANYPTAQLLRLPPYSPMLNPIENMWSALKSHLKRQNTQRFQELIEGDPNGQMTKMEWRLQLLEQSIERSRLTITPIMCLNFVNHLQYCFQLALNLDDMPLGQ